MREIIGMKFLGRRSGKFLLNSYVLAVVCLGIALATGIIGCAISSEEEKVPKVETVSPAPSQTPAGEKSPQPPAAAKEATLEEQPFRVQELRVHEERGQTIIRVRFTNPVIQYRHFPLVQPARLVLDVFGDAKRLSRVENFRVDTQWVGPLRLSSSEGYLRMVMEIAAAAPPPYVIEQEDGGLKVIIGPVNPAATGKKDLQLVQSGKRTDVQVAEPRAVSPAASPRAPVPQALPTGDKKYAGQRISLDFKDADIKNVFSLLA